MSKNFKFELNRNGVKELLKSQEMKSICAEKAAQIVSRCGAGYGSDTYTGATRVNAMVYASTSKAKRDNAENNTILKAMR